MPKMEVEYYIKKWLAGELSADEKNAFEKSADYKFLKKISSSVQAFKAPDYNVNTELEQLHLKKSGGNKVVFMRWMNPLLRIAAVFAGILIGYYSFYLNANTSSETTAGELSELYLPDSSHIILNAFTKVSYKEKKWEKNRQVKMDGEAYFSVAKGSKFDVVTNSGTVSVLGTQFNVKNRLDYFEVICYEGLVQIHSGSELVQLPPKHSYRIINGIMTKSDAFEEPSPTWLNNESSFRSVPFGQVLKEFERQYDVTLTTNNVNLDQLFTGRFANNDISIALQAITVPLNLAHEIVEEQHIILSGEAE